MSYLFRLIERNGSGLQYQRLPQSEEASLNLQEKIFALKCTRKLALLTSTCLLLSIFLLMNYIPGLVGNHTEVTEVWHHKQTIGIVTLKGPQRVLVGCRLILVEGSDEEKKPQILAKLSESVSTVEEVDFDLMLAIVQSCQELQTQRIQYSNLPNKGSTTASANGEVNMWTLLKGILPGTKWCGLNDIATDYHDLGVDFEVDKCCRAHDHCPVKVKAFSTNYGAKNNHPYTKSHCACDDLFYKCLKKITSPGQAEKAISVGRVYFNILRLECGEPVFPKVCLETIANPLSKDDSLTSKDKKRFFLNKNPSDDKLKRIPKEVCIRWEDDKEGIPNLVFRQQSKFF